MASKMTTELSNGVKLTKQYSDGLGKLGKGIDDVAKKHEELRSVISSVSTYINNSVNKVVGIIRKGLSIINSVMNGTFKLIKTGGSTVSRIIELFGSLGNRVKQSFGLASSSTNQFNGGLNILKGTATELRSKILIVTGAFKALFNNDMIKNATELYQSVYSMKNIVGGQLTQDTIDWANTMEKAFGLSAKQLIADMNELTGVLYGLGMKSKDVAVGSQNILLIGRYLAFMGAAGGDVNEVINKLVSGMKGMTASIDDLGLSAREAEMDSYLKKLKAQGGEFKNIGTSFANLNEEARVYIRYASLIEQFTTKYDMLDFAKSLDTVTGRISILKQSIYSLGTTIGQVLVTALSGVAQYIIVFIKYIEAQIKTLTSYMSNLFGFKIDTNFWSGMNDGIGDSVNSVEGLNKNLDETTEKAKKAVGSLAGFDRITSLNTKDESGSNVDGFDYTSLMATAIDGLNKLAEEATQSYVDSLNAKFASMVDNMQSKLKQYVSNLTGRADFDIEFDSEKATNSLKQIIANLVNTVKNSGLLVLEIGLKFADDINIGKLINDILELLRALSELLDVVTAKLRIAMNYLYDEYLSPLAEAFGINLSEAIQKVTSKIDELTEKIRGITDTEIFAYVDTLVEKLGILAKIFNGEDSDSINQFKEAHPVISKLVEIISELYNIVIILYNDILKPLFKDLVEFMGSEFLEWLLEKLGDVREFLDQNSGKIVELIETVAGIAWESFKIFVDLVGDLIGFVIEHPDSVIVFFSGLIALKVGSWATSTSVKLLELVNTLTALSAITGGGAGGAGGAGLLGGVTAGTVGSAALIGVAIAGIGLAFKDLWDTDENFKEHFTGIWKDIKDSFEDARTKLSEGFERLSESLSILYDAYESSGLKGLVGIIMESLGTFVGFLLEVLIKTLGTVGKFILSGISVIIKAFSGIINIVGGVIQLVIGIFTMDGDRIKKAASTFAKGIVQVISSIGEGLYVALEAAVTLVIDTVKLLIKNMIDLVKTLLGIKSPSKVFEDIGINVIKGMLDGISNTFENLLTTVVKLFNNMLDSIKNVFSNIGEWFAKTFTSAKDAAVNSWSNIKELFTNVKNKLTSAFNDSKAIISLKLKDAKDASVNAWADSKTKFTSIANGIFTSFEGLKSKFSNLWTGIKTNAMNILSGIGNVTSNIGNSISSRFGVVTSGVQTATAVTSVPNVRYRAVGGSERAGQLFIANENGAELVGNIRGAGGADIANNTMIIKAIQLAMENGMGGAIQELVQLMSTTGKSGDTYNIIGEGGINVIDQATWSKIQSNIAPLDKKNNIKRADSAFMLR